MKATWSNRFKNVIFPSVCLCCGLASRRYLSLCESCEESFPRLGEQCWRCAEPMAISSVCGRCQKSAPEFSRIVTPYRYQYPLNILIPGLKHHRQLPAAEVLGILLARHIKNNMAIRPDCIVAMPLHWKRRVLRGYNQAGEIARYLARDLAIPVTDKLVRRQHNTPMQQGFKRKDRQRNLRNSFITSGDCRDLHIAVVDDVVTTTSTARAVAACLRQSGAKNVEIWAVARTALEN